MTSVQFIERDGKPEYAIVPIALWQRLVPLLEAAATSPAETSADDPALPAEVDEAQRRGVHPVRAWREYRGMTEEDLANFAGISVPVLNQIETGKRPGTITVLSALAQALGIPIATLDV
jgi:DNA-binding XRE family transcriptional regulator